MRLRLLSVGRDRSGLYAPAVEEYAKRISRYVKFAVEEVAEARKAAGTPRARDEEAASLLDRIADGERVVLLDERGKEGTSLEFARRVGAWVEGAKDVTLVIGGSDGHGEAIRARAAETHLPVAAHPRPPPGPARARRAGLPGLHHPSRRAIPQVKHAPSPRPGPALARDPPVLLRTRGASPRLSLPFQARPPRRARSNCPR